MKIFLCSTSYDLGDLRGLIVELLEKYKHEVLFFENPKFSAGSNEHSHDICLRQIDNVDLLLYVADRRFGGKYSGNELNGKSDLKYSILGSTRSGKKRRYDYSLCVKEMSISWCEIRRAYEKGIPVKSFARKRLLDEKQVRRANQHIKTFRTVFADNEKLYDLLDWITSQEKGNWIVDYNDHKELLRKLEVMAQEWKNSAVN